MNKLPNIGYYWKYVDKDESGYSSHWQKYEYKTGLNKTKSVFNSNLGYRIGFHLYRNKNDAHTEFGDCIIRCKVNKKDIVAIGKDYYDDINITIVTTRFWCPKPK